MTPGGPTSSPAASPRNSEPPDQAHHPACRKRGPARIRTRRNAGRRPRAACGLPVRYRSVKRGEERPVSSPACEGRATSVTSSAYAASATLRARDCSAHVRSTCSIARRRARVHLDRGHHAGHLHDLRPRRAPRRWRPGRRRCRRARARRARAACRRSSAWSRSRRRAAPAPRSTSSVGMPLVRWGSPSSLARSRTVGQDPRGDVVARIEVPCERTAAMCADAASPSVSTCASWAIKRLLRSTTSPDAAS